jgi:quercetin dioxygenase-like cupin family protein
MAPYTFLENIDTEVPIPENGILSRTLFNDEALKVVAFWFSSGQELSAHTAPMAAILYFMRGEAELTLGDAELQKLAVNPWSAPYRVFAAHSAN